MCDQRHIWFIVCFQNSFGFIISLFAYGHIKNCDVCFSSLTIYVLRDLGVKSLSKHRSLIIYIFVGLTDFA